MAVSVLAWASARAGYRAASTRHLCTKGLLHHGRPTPPRARMGVTASCRSGTGADSDGAITPAEVRKMSSGSKQSDAMVEAVICQEQDLPNEGMKTFEMEGGKVLVVHHGGQLSALGSKCSHYGAPLEKGSVCGDTIRCPWHGACFSLATGDIEDFPGLDSIPRYDIKVEEGQVKVRASKALLAADRRTKTLATRDPDNTTTFVIIGGGAAGATCVERLRQEGFSGRVIMVTQESHLPYDRPKLSKAMDLTPEEITLRSRDFYEGGDIEVLLGVSAQAIKAQDKVIQLSTGETLAYDKLFLATGGRPRRLGVPGDDLAGVHVVRVPEDANTVAQAAAGKQVVVVGTSFIGMEAAAYLLTNDRAASVTIVGNTAVPFERSLGPAVGRRIQQLFEEKGATFINEANVAEFIEEDGVLQAVALTSGERVDAEVVVLGVGVVPNTDFLATSTITRDERGYVTVNEHLETSVADVYCGGDIASFPLFLEDGAQVAIGHWQVALGHGRTAALNMLGRAIPVKSVPFFWTVLFGKSLRYTGYGQYDDVIVGGDLENLAFIAYYLRGEKVVALASLGKDPAAARYADMLQQGKFLTREQVAADDQVALTLSCQ